MLKDQPREFTYEFVWFDGEEAVGRTGCKGVGLAPTAAATTCRPRKKANALTSIKAMILVDMIGDREPARSTANRTPRTWLKDVIWGAAKKLGHGAIFIDAGDRRSKTTTCRSSTAGVPSVDIIDLDYPAVAQRRRAATT